jgi:uncharacterized protein (DUF1800 family)
MPARKADSTAAVAAHRFGLGEPDLAVVGADPARWLLKQLGPLTTPEAPNAPPGPALEVDPLVTSAARIRFARVLRETRRLRDKVKNAAEAASRPATAGGAGGVAAGVGGLGVRGTGIVRTEGLRLATRPTDAGPRLPKATSDEPLRAALAADVIGRIRRALTTPRPFVERLVRFFANHFAVSAARPEVRWLVGPYEREAIGPHVAGRFVDLLRAAVTHPAMLRYLDNARSIGPASPAGQRRKTGLNENLAREVLELHTLGVRGGYTQADVQALAAILTGWSVDARTGRTHFYARRHEPGDKVLLGTRIPEGGEAELEAALTLLAAHPATATHLATKLARHFVADEPPPALVEALATAYARTSGDLTAMYRALVSHPAAWAPAPAKLRPPEDWALSVLRMLGVSDAPDRELVRAVDRFARLAGHPPGAPPSPAGFPDVASAWLGPDALLTRIEWATVVARRISRGGDGKRPGARILARRALGARLSDGTDAALLGAADETEAFALLLVSPEVLYR